MNLSDIITKYIRTKDSGLLSIKVEGESHLLKIYFGSGEVVSLNLGTCKDEECLKKLDSIVPLEHFFVRGVKPPTKSSTPLTEKLIAHTGMSAMEVDAGIPSTHGVNIQPSVITDVEEEFIDLIGPIGKMIVDNIFSEISSSRGKPMPSEDYSYLLESLIKELPAKQQEAFRAKYRRGIK
ncbi:MAG: hypothetical protein HY035_06865 [Nitrospirae bacterium]|nr:hypothetical protein [Nitrospirota bacterium]